MAHADHTRGQLGSTPAKSAEQLGGGPNAQKRYPPNEPIHCRMREKTGYSTFAAWLANIKERQHPAGQTQDGVSQS